MSKFCPIQNRKVVYIDCIECEDKICKNNKSQKPPQKQQSTTKEGEKHELRRNIDGCTY
jgi:hypothetical protein